MVRLMREEFRSFCVMHRRYSRASQPRILLGNESLISTLDGGSNKVCLGSRQFHFGFVYSIFSNCGGPLNGQMGSRLG